jgi:hypothetical protein
MFGWKTQRKDVHNENIEHPNFEGMKPWKPKFV